LEAGAVGAGTESVPGADLAELAAGGVVETSGASAQVDVAAPITQKKVKSSLNAGFLKQQSGSTTT
jgi:hypothetical protein